MSDSTTFLALAGAMALFAGFAAWALCRAAARGDAMLAEAYDMGKIAADFEREVLGPQREATSAAFDKALDLEPYKAIMDKVVQDLAAEVDIPPTFIWRDPVPVTPGNAADSLIEMTGAGMFSPATRRAFEAYSLPWRFLAGVDVLSDPGWIDDDGFFVSERERR